MTTQAKSKRLDIRVSPEHDSVIREVAAKRSQTVSEFLIDSAMVQVEIEMADRKHVTLDAASWDEFVAALDSPPKVNERLFGTIDRAKAIVSP